MTEAATAMKSAEKAKEANQFDECIQFTSTVTSIAPQLARVRQLRARCHIAKGEIEEAAGDLT